MHYAERGKAMNLSTLKSLQSRIREATGADRVLDLRIQRMFDGESLPYEDDAKLAQCIGAWDSIHLRVEDRDMEGRWSQDPPDIPLYTTDPDGLGACVGLMRKVLPGYWWCAGDDAVGDCVASVRRDEKSPEIETTGVTANHALLLAICAALIAEEEAKELFGEKMNAESIRR